VTRARYPWEPLESLRRGARAEAEAELGRMQSTLERARAELALAEQALEAQLARMPQSTELAAPGRASGLVLQRAAGHARRLAHEASCLHQARVQAETRVRAREAALETARRALAAARDKERALERDRERFSGEQRRARERAEQLELDERAAREARRGV
jgi:flagellar biosynthesis chaperone FliJ